MPTSRSEIRDWLRQLTNNTFFSHMMVVTDEFDWSDYPVYVTVEEDIDTKIKEYTSKTMSNVMEVYNREIDLEAQLNEHRAWHPHTQEPEINLPTSNYPEHDRMKALMDDTQGIGEFVEWLCRKYVIAEYDEKRDELTQVRRNSYASDMANSLLADYYDIDLKKISDEKDAILEEVREQNTRRDLEQDLKELTDD